jgi:hypothetical protein
MSDQVGQEPGAESAGNENELLVGPVQGLRQLLAGHDPRRYMTVPRARQPPHVVVHQMAD